MGRVVDIILFLAVGAVWAIDVATTAKYLNTVFEPPTLDSNAVTNFLASIILVAWATNTAAAVFVILFGGRSKNHGTANALTGAAVAIGWVAFGLACKQQKIGGTLDDVVKSMAAFAIIGAPVTTFAWVIFNFSNGEKPFGSE